MESSRLPILFQRLLCALASLTAAQLAAQEPAEPRTTLGGYGEVHYTNRSGPGSPGVVNVKRFVIYLAHQFDDRITLRSELELEDARIEGGAAGGEVALEQLYLDYTLSESVTLRAGLLLPPVGIINELHEPPGFNGVARPDFHHDVIPTTWREIGVGAVGTIASVPGLAWRAYVVNGLRSDGFSAGEGIRGGRQEGREATFANPSLTARLEYGRPGLKLGGALWYGGSAAQDTAVGRGTFDAPVVVLAADARYDVGGFAFRGEVARVTIGDAARINAAYLNGIGRRIEGGYVEGAANLLRWAAPASRQRLLVFARHERYDTHAAVPAGVARDPALARRITTMGLAWKPVWNVAFKADYQLHRTRAGTAAFEVASLGVGYQF